MNTVKFTTPDENTRYYLTDESGTPVPEVMDYLRFLGKR